MFSSYSGIGALVTPWDAPPALTRSHPPPPMAIDRLTVDPRAGSESLPRPDPPTSGEDPLADSPSVFLTGAAAWLVSQDTRSQRERQCQQQNPVCRSGRTLGKQLTSAEGEVSRPDEVVAGGIPSDSSAAVRSISLSIPDASRAALSAVGDVGRS